MFDYKNCYLNAHKNFKILYSTIPLFQRERLQRFTLEVAKHLGGTVCGDLYSPMETGAAQLSADDVKETVELLSVYPKNKRLFKALNELRDDLLDSSAWEVVMQWFYVEDL